MTICAIKRLLNDPFSVLAVSCKICLSDSIHSISGKAFDLFSFFHFTVPIRKAVKFHVYDEFLSGKSELAIAKELSMTIDRVVDAIHEMEAEDEEYAKATGASLLNQPKELKLSEKELELKRLEKQALPFLQRMFRGLD